MLEGLIIGFMVGGAVFGVIAYHHGFNTGHAEAVIELSED